MENEYFSRTERLKQQKSERSHTARLWLATINRSIASIAVLIESIFPNGLF